MTDNAGEVAGGGSDAGAGVITSFAGSGNSDDTGVSGTGMGFVAGDEVSSLTCCRIGESLKPPCSANDRSKVNSRSLASTWSMIAIASWRSMSITSASS